MFQPLVRVVFTVSLLLAGTTGQAAEAPINCVKVDKDGGSQYEMNVCQGQKFGAADAELNKVYGQLRQLFQQNKDTEGEMLMIKAQRAWVTWRMAKASGLRANQRLWPWRVGLRNGGPVLRDGPYARTHRKST
jgi:uncharacterized protein YecT (DUF1311 family)